MVRTTSQIRQQWSGVALFGQATGLIAMPTATLTSQASVFFPSASYLVACAPAHTPNDPPHAARGHFALSSTRQVIFYDNDGNQEAVIYFCPLASD